MVWHTYFSFFTKKFPYNEILACFFEEEGKLMIFLEDKIGVATYFAAFITLFNIYIYHMYLNIIFFLYFVFHYI